MEGPHYQNVSSPYGQTPRQDAPRQVYGPGLDPGLDDADRPAPSGPATAGGRKVGLSTALGLMLAGAVAAGSVTGVAVSSLGSDSGGEADAPAAANDGPSNSLEAPSADAPPAEEGSVEHVASTVLPAVVSIQVVTPGSAGEGSGSIISQDGYVLTNHHVVGAAGENGTIQVTLHDGRQIPADLVASDPATDIGVIKIRDQQGLPTIQFGDSSQLNVGQEVVAVGAPLGLSGTVTSGIVSALNRPVRATQDGGESSLIDGIQTDAAINPGNSGGPLVDMNGHIIGMNSVIATASQTSGSIGLGFAIPSNFAQRVAQQLIEDGRAVQPMLGVTVDIRSQARGAQVNEVMPDGPAAQAGIEPGEVIRRIDDRAIDTADALIAAVRSQDFGETVTLEVYNPERDETRSVDVTLSEE
ncbi:Putative serine protease HtrA [Corynebacterium guangdongense]|uniref:Serine protease PepD n=1 Tax=Corynebacterium guangdongense TaxID=1783348 RepID=A0ABU1ZV79_9CORY|nr:trypsin-like peptidase domain-containing protein [Corynebacterium guangdongense]MDR7328834.1 putative serine protease PepD [Corynebacterium guangdongense]WJZ17409.1 Putative serine protease HtrA [Corynebacterium guangdongense]